MKKKEIYKEITELNDTYCQDCFVKKHFRKEYGKAVAHSFCITKCTVGEKLKDYGRMLSNESAKINK